MPELFAGLQPTPQPAQLLSVVSGASQPSPGPLLQLPKPGSHAPSVQLPLPHASAAFARLQLTPHPPQLVSVVVGVSQPLLGSESQFA